MDESLPWPFFKINDFLEVYLDKNHEWHVVHYKPDSMEKYCYGNRITRILYKMDQFTINRKITIKDSWFGTIYMYPTCFTVTNTKGIEYIRSYIDGEIIKKFPSGTFSPNPIEMDIKFANCKIQVIRYDKCYSDLPSAAIIGYRPVSSRYDYKIIDNYILIFASDVDDIKNTEKYTLTYTKIQHDMIIICVRPKNLHTKPARHQLSEN